jgi:hypothetical protein
MFIDSSYPPRTTSTVTSSQRQTRDVTANKIRVVVVTALMAAQASRQFVNLYKSVSTSEAAGIRLSTVSKGGQGMVRRAQSCCWPQAMIAPTKGGQGKSQHGTNVSQREALRLWLSLAEYTRLCANGTCLPCNCAGVLRVSAAAPRTGCACWPLHTRHV